MSFKMRLEWSHILDCEDILQICALRPSQMRLFHAFQQFDSLYTTKSQDQHSPTSTRKQLYL